MLEVDLPDLDLEQLRVAIVTLPEVVTARLQSVARTYAHKVEASARFRVPVDTGYTRENIHVVEDLPNKQFLVVPGTDRPRQTISLHIRRNGKKHTQKVTLNMLPNWIEYGTKFQAPRPFMRPAADAYDAAYKRDMAAAAEQVVIKVLG